METIDLRFEGVSKKYLVRREREADAALHPWLRKLKSLRRRAEEFWALRDVSFAVRRGETLGIIGHNGAGKSTILKLLSNITSPTSGEITISGRLSALIEVGSGFHPELTGRENVYLNGAILGMRRREIDEKLDSIADFAGIRQFLDVPVKRFSSGMYVRLGFSIAAHLDPDILLLDEVLAVGDAAFQEKCLNRIAELRRAGKTIVFISHDLAAVERVCDRVILLRRGEIVMDGAPRAVVAEYQSHAGASTLNVSGTLVESDRAEVLALSFGGGREGRAGPHRTGGPLAARVEFAAYDRVEDAVVEIVIFNPERQVVCHLTTESGGGRLTLEPGPGVLEFHCTELGLLPGLYGADVGVKERGAPEAIHWLYEAASLRVDPGQVVRGNFYQPHSWELLESGVTPAPAQTLSRER